jgi:hypothetical protein
MTYQFECNECGDTVETPNNDMQGAWCEDVNTYRDETDEVCPGEMQLVDSW